MEIDCYTFQVILKDAFIDRMKQTQEGQEYLENCYLLQQTAPDREALRSHFERG